MHVRVYIPIHLLQAHNTIPQTGSLTNITTETLAYGFYCNQASDGSHFDCGIAHVGTEQSRVSEGDVRDETSF